MYDDTKLNEMKSEYNDLCQKEHQLESQLNEVRARRIELQREIARNQTPQQEAKTLSMLYEQRVLNRKK